MRSFGWIGVVVLTATAAWAQPDPTANLMEKAFAQLRMNSSLYIDLDGVEYLSNNRQIPIRGELAWKFTYDLDGKPKGQVELMDYRANRLIRRIAGDGTVLWNYDVNRNEYSSMTYGSFSGGSGSNYAGRLVQGLSAAAEGPSAYLVRLIRDMNASSGNSYRTWIPGGTAQLIQDGAQPYEDPVRQGWKFRAVPTISYAAYALGSPARRSLVFELVQDQSGNWAFSRFFFAERSGSGSTSKFVEWVGRILPSGIPSSVMYGFIPPTGARPVSLPRSGG